MNEPEQDTPTRFQRWIISVCPECGHVGIGLGTCPAFHGLDQRGSDRIVRTERIEVVPAETAQEALEERDRLREWEQAVLHAINLYGDETLHRALDNIGWKPRQSTPPEAVTR